MKSFTKKSFLQKIIITILVALLLSNFIVPTYSQADIGGVLISPIVDFVCSLGDIVINLLQRCMTGDWGSTGAVNWSLSAFLMESEEYYAKYGTSASGTVLESNKVNPDDPEEGFDKGWLGLKDEYYIPVATYSPEQIFTGKVAGLDINFINPNKYTTSDGTAVESSAARLQETIASWYIALRNLAIVGLLSVLVYVGIRIIISSTAADKAKYKQMLTDWIIALCILFFLHYIMSFVLTLTESITQAIAGDGANTVVVQDEAKGATFSTNLLGLARFKTQYADMGQKVTFLIFYIALVIYTLIFTWTYLKRLLMMAFLTLIAPLVALTYPIDKISDGKAQAFDTWLKEYIFNALLQPFHLIIYMVFVGSAIELAQTNIIYGIAAMAFILPAEKILRNIFGFNKAGAGTIGALTGFTAGSLANKFLGRKGGSGAKGGSSGNNKVEGEKPPRFEKKHDVGQIEGGDINGNLGQGNGPEDGPENEPDTALDKYKEEGYGQNINGEYYNPWTDEYDANYDPHKDPAYARQQNPAPQNPTPPKEGPQGGQSSPRQQNSESSKSDKEKENKGRISQGFKNLARAHDITPRGIGKRTIKGVKNAGKFAVRTTFKAGVGTVAGAVAVASGGGLAGATAAYMTASSIGGRVADGVMNAPSRMASAARREADIFKGNTNLQDKAKRREWKKDDNNLKYLRDQMATQNGGIMPSAREVRAQMNSFDPYLAEGLSDIKEMLKAQKAEQYMQGNQISKQSAIIAAIGKEKGITADVLNDQKKATAAHANLRQDFINKGYSAEVANNKANYTMNVLKVQNGVANSLQGGSQQTKEPKATKNPSKK